MFVTRIVERLDPELRAWRNRPLERIYGVVYVDAPHLKVHHAHGVRSTACTRPSRPPSTARCWTRKTLWHARPTD